MIMARRRSARAAARVGCGERRADGMRSAFPTAVCVVMAAVGGTEGVAHHKDDYALLVGLELRAMVIVELAVGSHKESTSFRQDPSMVATRSQEDYHRVGIRSQQAPTHVIVGDVFGRQWPSRVWPSMAIICVFGVLV